MDENDDILTKNLENWNLIQEVVWDFTFIWIFCLFDVTKMDNVTYSVTNITEAIPDIREYNCTKDADQTPPGKYIPYYTILRPSQILVSVFWRLRKRW